MPPHISDPSGDPSINRRHALVAGGASLSALLTFQSAGAQTSRPRPDDPYSHEHLLNDPADASRPDTLDRDWSPISFLGEEGRFLQSLSLMPALPDAMLGHDSKLHPDTKFPVFRPVRYHETDPELLRYLSYRLPRFPLCFALPDSIRGGWGGSGMRLAVLRMETNVDTFWISITRIGFALGAHGADFHSIFFSALLARVLGEMYERACGEPVPRLIADALSGERHIREDLEKYDRWKASRKKP